MSPSYGEDLLNHISCRILSWFQIWPSFWPQRLHFRAQPQSFLMSFDGFMSVKVWLQNKPFGFSGFLPKKWLSFLPYGRSKESGKITSNFRVFSRHWKWLSRNILHQKLTFFLNLNIFVKTFVSPLRHCKQIGCVIQEACGYQNKSRWINKKTKNKCFHEKLNLQWNCAKSSGNCSL